MPAGASVLDGVGTVLPPTEAVLTVPSKETTGVQGTQAPKMVILLGCCSRVDIQEEQ